MNNGTFAQQIFYFSFGKINSTCKLDENSSCLIPRGSKKEEKRIEKRKKNILFCSFPDSLLSKFRRSFLKITHARETWTRKREREWGREGGKKRKIRRTQRSIQRWFIEQTHRRFERMINARIPNTLGKWKTSGDDDELDWRGEAFIDMCP